MAGYKVNVPFQTRSQNYEMRLLASSCLCVHLSVCLSVRTKQHISYFQKYVLTTWVYIAEPKRHAGYLRRSTYTQNM
jgi:hypothetical protein